MARLSTGLLKKMNIKPYTDPDYTQAKNAGIEVMLNPGKYTHSYSIQYNEISAMGANGASPRFCKIATEKVAFELVYDGTGIVSLGELDVDKHIQDLKATVYNYDGKEHEPNYVQLIWGTLVFNCRLSTMSVSFTLFDPSGIPLRAKVQLEFIGFTDPATLAKEANKSSPDLTHIVQVKAGETLPLLCFRIYKESQRYIQVAEHNGLDDFRNIKPGDRLIFPAIK